MTTSALDLWQHPEAEEIYLFVGWRQWADAGSISSRLPIYLYEQVNATQIGEIKSDGFYLFQVPGLHHLMRPVVQFKDGFPESLEAPRNEIYYAGDQKRGIVFMLGDEPHINIEGYVEAILDMATILNVKQIIGFGGVYGELPYDQARSVHAIYSNAKVREALESLSVEFSNYQGGASIGSYCCRRAAERDLNYAAFYAFVPYYDFSSIPSIGSAIQPENDFGAWLEVMRRVNHFLKLDFDLTDLEKKNQELTDTITERVNELIEKAPDSGLREYFEQLASSFDSKPFIPLDDVWEEEIDHLFEDLDLDDL